MLINFSNLTQLLSRLTKTEIKNITAAWKSFLSVAIIAIIFVIFPLTGWCQEVVILEGWESAQGMAQEPMAPFQLEKTADIIALGTIGKPFRHQGKQLLELTISEIIKGKGTYHKLFPEDSATFFGCLPPRRLPRPSEQLSPGSPVIVYLTIHNHVLGIHYINKQPHPLGLERIKKFLGVYEMIQSDSPPWDTLFPKGTVGLDDSTLYALSGFEKKAGGELIRILNDSILALENTQSGVTEFELSKINNLIYAVNRLDPSPQALPSLIILWEWVTTHQDNVATLLWQGWFHSPHLAQANDGQSRQLLSIFETLLKRTHPKHGYQQILFGFAMLPKAVGIPYVLQELEMGHSEAANTLRWWVELNPSETAIRNDIKEKTIKLQQALVSEPDADITFARHLELLLRYLP